MRANVDHDTAGPRRVVGVAMDVTAHHHALDALREASERAVFITSHAGIGTWESDPDGCAACQGPQLGYRNGTLYASYTAACFARNHELAEKHGVNLLGALTWAFEFEDQPIFGGFRALATDGVELPVLNTFRMLNRMGKNRLAAESSGPVSKPK